MLYLQNDCKIYLKEAGRGVDLLHKEPGLFQGFLLFFKNLKSGFSWFKVGLWEKAGSSPSSNGLAY